jgi:hypothetical protein
MICRLFQYEISANAKAQQTTDGLGGNIDK